MNELRYTKILRIIAVFGLLSIGACKQENSDDRRQGWQVEDLNVEGDPAEKEPPQTIAPTLSPSPEPVMEPAPTEPTASPSPEPVAEPTPTEPADPSNGSVRLQALLITPEQASGAFNTGLNFTLTESGRDLILSAYEVQLGGIDFLATERRDFNAKVSTLLTIRRIAWDVASGVIERDRQKLDPSVDVFTECDIIADRPLPPGDTDAATERWEAQVAELSWRLYSRAPRPDEIDHYKQAFLDVLETEGSHAAAWKVVLFAMISTIEFWYT